MKKMTAILVTLCMLAALLAGCGGASKSTQAFDAAAAAPAEARMALTMIWRAPNRKTAD